jgi:AcrR family transcriptional regulator
MAHSSASKEALVNQLRAVFVARGYDGATLTNLSQATSLSKASLYHHFPGGKPEMAAALVRHTIADLQRLAFSQLNTQDAPRLQLLNFVDGFSVYTENGASDCLLAVFNHHSTASEETADQQQIIAAQLEDWHLQLARVFEQSGLKPKKAAAEAQDLLAALYGALLLAKMHNHPPVFTSAAKRIKKRLKQQFAQT